MLGHNENIELMFQNCEQESFEGKKHIQREYVSMSKDGVNYQKMIGSRNKPESLNQLCTFEPRNYIEFREQNRILSNLHSQENYQGSLGNNYEL